MMVCHNLHEGGAELSNSIDIFLLGTLWASRINHAKGMFLTWLFLVSIDFGNEKNIIYLRKWLSRKSKLKSFLLGFKGNVYRPNVWIRSASGIWFWLINISGFVNGLLLRWPNKLLLLYRVRSSLRTN